MDVVVAIAAGTWETFFLAAPFVLFGLALAGVLHVTLSRRTVERWMGGRGLGAAAKAAAFGVPLPICSCGVVPVSIELQRKGASRPASLSFLVTTPESSADAVLLTWGLLGPVMAVVRPVASFATGLLAAVLGLVFPERRPEAAPGESAPAPAEAGDPDCCNTGELAADREPESERPAAGGRWRRAVRYAFVEMLDDIAFWLVVGVLVAGVIQALAPADLGSSRLGSGLLPMLVLLVAGIPLYVCASASTPVGAVLMAKGISPGAVLVFLLAGPATNAASLVLLLRHFGKSFVRIYLVSIAVGSLAAGLALDAALAALGWRIVPQLEAHSHGVVGAMHWLLVTVFGVLLVWRLGAGALRDGWAEAAASLRGLLTLAGSSR